MAYWWQKEEQKDSGKQSSNQQTSEHGYWWQKENFSTTIGTNITNRVNAWLKNHNNYIKDYQSRYSGRKYSYEDAYVSDSGDWLDTVSKQKSALKTEAESILAYMDQFSSYLDAGWVRSVRDTLIGANQQQKSIVAGATNDNEWWSSFGSEDMVKQYGSAEEAYKAHQRYDGYSKKYDGMTSTDLGELLNYLNDGEEKDWLTSHKASVYNDEMLKYDVAGNEENLRKLEQILSQYDNLRQYYDAYQKNPDAYSGSEYENLRTMADIFSQYQQTFGSKKELEKLVHDTRLNINNAKRIQKNAELASVADSTSKTYDPEFGKYSSYVSDGETPLIPDYKDIAYDAVNGNTDSLGLAVGQSRFGTISGSELQRLDAIRHMNEDEKALYNYYYNKYGYEAAEEYLDTIIDSLNYLHGKKLFEPMENKWLLEELFAIAAGFDQFHSGVTSFLSGDDYIPTSAMQYASGMVREDLADNSIPMWYNFKTGKWEDKILGNSLGQGVYDLITTTSNMAPSILTSMAVGAINPTAGVAAGNALMGVSSAGNAYQEALNLGYDKGQARVYSTLVGASEVGLQYLIGGIGKLGGKLSGKAATSLASKFDNAYARLAVKYGTNMLSEGAEEYLQEVLTPVFKNLALGTDEEISLITEDAIYSFLLGAISSGFMEGTGISSENGKGIIGNLVDMSSKNKANIEAVNLYGGSTKELIEEGLASESGSESRQLAEMMKRKTDRGKSMSGYEIRSLVEANEAQFAVENYDAAVKTAREKLTKLGESKNIDKIAKLVAKKVTGQELTASEKSTLVRSQFGAQVAKEMTRPVVETQSGPKSYNATYKSLEDRVGTESRYGVSESGQATVRESNEKVSLDNAEVVKIEDGEMTVKLEDGREVYAGDIDFADDTQAYAFSAVADIENITPAAATAIIRDLDLSKPVGAQLNGVDEAYTYGYHGYSVADLKAGQYTSNLTNEQMMSAYKLGKSARKISDADADAPIVKMRTAAEAAISKKEKVAKQKARFESDDVEVYFQDGKSVVKFDERSGKYDDKRMAAVNTAKFLSKLGIGGKYYFFESYVNDDGVRVYKDSNGNEVEAPNGMYKDADGSIHIDLNAGNAGQGTALFTMGHELAHFVKAQSKKQFKILGDLVAEAFDKTDLSMHERVLEKQEFLSKKRGHQVSYNEAYEEVVADAMSTMLTDGSFFDKLMEIKVKDKGLFNTIKRFFEKMIAKFKKVYEELAPDQRDARDIREMKDMFDRIQTAFAEALVEASESYQAAKENVTDAKAEKNTTQGGEVMYMSRDIADVTEDTVRSDLTDVFNGNNVSANSYIPISKTTPFALRYITRQMANLPMIVEKKKAYFDMRENGKFKEDSSHHYHGMGVDGFLKAMDILENPEYAIREEMKNGSVHFAFISTNDVGEEVCVVFQMGVTKPAVQMNGYPGGYYNLDITEFVATDEWLDEHRVEPGTSYKDYLLSFSENSIAYDRRFHLEQLEKARIIDSESAGLAASYDNNRASNDRVTQPDTIVKNESLDNTDVEIDTKTESVAPAVIKSERTNYSDRDFFADGVKSSYTVSEISDMFDAWNSEPELEDLAKRAFTKLEEIISKQKDEQEKNPLSSLNPYSIAFVRNESFVRPYLDIPHGSFAPDFGIYYNIDHFMEFSNQEKAHVLLHEAIHACTYIAIASAEWKIPQFSSDFDVTPDDSWSEEQKAGLTLIQTFNQVRTINNLLDRVYGQKSVYEMVAEMSNPEFRAMLKKHKLWDRIVDAIKGIFGITQRTTYDAVSYGLEKILELDMSEVRYSKHTWTESDIMQEREEAAREYKSGHKGAKFSDRDSTYIDAVNRGDMKTAQRMVDEAARSAGYAVKAYHGTDADAFNVFDKGKFGQATGVGILGDGFYFADSKKIAQKYGKNVYTVYLKQINPYAATDRDAYQLRSVSIERQGYDSVVLPTGNGKVYMVLDSNQIKSAEPVTYDDSGNIIPLSQRFNPKNDDIRYSERTSHYAYESLISKPDMVVTTVSSNIPKNRADVVYQAKQNAAKVGVIDPKTGSVSVHVDDIGVDVLLGTDGLKHGLRRTKDAQNDANYIVTLKAGEIIKNSIKVNEMTPKKADAKVSLVLIGVARNLNGDTYVVRSIVNSFSNELTSIDVLYAINAKKELAAIKSPRFTAEPLSETSSTISIAELLDLVNQYFPDILPEDVLKHYGYDARPEGDFGDNVLYSERTVDSVSNRSLLANAFEGITNGSEEYKLIQEYKSHIKELNELDTKLHQLNAEIRKIRFGTDGARDTQRLARLESKAKEVAKEINRYDKRLLSLEASAPLRKVIERERKKEAQKTKEHVKEIQQNKKARAEQAELRHKIRKAVRDLDKLLNRGNKKLNVKEDMKGFASKALELADYLFIDHISNDELIRKGITVRMTPKEAALVKETEDILTKLYDHADSLTDEEFTRLDAKRKANEDKLRDLLTAQRNERLSTPVYQLFDDLVKAYASLKNSSQDAVKAAYDEELEKSLRAFMSDDARVKILENMRVADMTTEELNWLYRAYTMVLNNVRNANKFHVKGMTETIDQKVGRIVSDFGNRKIPDGKVAIVARNLANKIGWDYEKLYYALDRIGSEAFTELIMNLANSENIVMQDVMEATAFRNEIVEKYGFNNWAVNKEIDREFLDNTGKKFKLTLGQMMALYAYSRREGAWDHIEYGGFSFKDTPITENNSAASYKLSKAQCEAITDLLTKDQKGYVEAMQKYLSETMGAKGNEVSMMLYGIKMFGEKNYFPIHIDGRFMAQAKESQAKVAAGFGTMSNAGFTHAQNPNAKAPFVLEGFNEIWADHVNEMSRYHGSVPALEDIRRVMNRSSYSDAYMESMSVKAVMENAFGKDAVAYFDNLYREANSGAIQDKLQRKSKKLLSLFRKGSVAYSLSVVIQQPSAIKRAYAMIDPKYFGFKGFGALTSGMAKAVTSKWNKAYSDTYNKMLKYAPGVTLAKEIGGFDTHTGASIREYLLDTKKGFAQKLKTGTVSEKGKAVLGVVDNNAIANLPNVTDKIAWMEIWNACERETVAKHKDLTPGSDEFLQTVGDRFTEVIRATQVYDSIFAKSPMLKSKNLAVQYLVSFMNEPNTTANMVEKAVRDTVKGDWKSGFRTAAAVTYSIIFNNVLKSIIYAMRDDDEDETYQEKYIEAVIGSLMSDFNPLSYIPIARDAWSIAQGYDVERADMAIIADALDALGQVIKNGFTDTEEMTEEQLVQFDRKVTEANWKLVESMAAFFGIPVKNIRREINAVLDHARIASANAGLTTDQSRWDAIYDAVLDSIPFVPGNRSKTDKLYDALVSGDTVYVNRMKAGYKDDDAYHSAVRTALRENDPRIKEAAQAHINGDPSKRVEIAKKIIADLGKEYFNDVITAINSEISKLTPDKESSGTAKVKGYYKAEDFVREYANGDTASLDAIREDILQTAQANGKTEAEAQKGFVSDIKSEAKESYLAGALDDSTAKKLLTEYADMDEEEAAETISYWSFCKANPDADLNESQVKDYQEFAEPANIPLDVFVQYVNGIKGLGTIRDDWGDVLKTKKEQVLEVIDSLPLTWQQKDALYLAAGYAESTLWDVPW